MPFCGDGDLAVELYSGRDIWGADIDPARVRAASARLPQAHLVAGDCDQWPFQGIALPPIAIADLDSYAYPYDALRALLQHGTLTSPAVIYGTDGEKQAVSRARGWHHPDGSRHPGGTLVEKRRLYNFWWGRVVEPYLRAVLAPRVIVKAIKYLRKDQVYWGIVVR